MADILKHDKHLDIADSPDPALLQPSDYNKGHKFVGGLSGQVIIRNEADATYGADWSSLPTLDGFISSFAPISSPIDGCVWVEVSGTSPARTASLRFRDGGVTRTLVSITY